MRELTEAVRKFGERPLAVRSSSVAEHLPGMSYAGQYETVLNVRGEDDLRRAVKTCWSSAFSSRVAAYQSPTSPRSAGMAVLIQPMVLAESAGVAFSANPVTGARDQVVINAVRGTGERMVGGSASPDQWLISDNNVMPQATPEHAIDVDQARAIAQLVRDVERHFGCPQDIEWAIGGGELSLLQARPITALPSLQLEPPPGYWERETSHCPKPFSPFCRSLEPPTVNAGFRAMFDEFGFVLETLELQEIGGWAYLRAVPISDGELLARRVSRCIQAVRSQHHRALLTRWEREWRPELRGRIKQLGEVDLNAPSDAGLDQHVGQVADLFQESHRIHFLLQGAIVLALGGLASTCRELLGWDDAKTLELLNGLSTTSTEPAIRLWELAAMVRSKPQVAAWLQHLEAEATMRLDDVDVEFAAAFRRFQDEFGGRVLN